MEEKCVYCVLMLLSQRRTIGDSIVHVAVKAFLLTFLYNCYFKPVIWQKIMQLIGLIGLKTLIRQMWYAHRRVYITNKYYSYV